jgi:hypothetical protein
MTPIHERVAGVAALLALALSPVAALGDEPAELGRVTAVKGRAVAQHQGQPDRVLRCNDPIYDGDLVVTSDQARVGFLMGEVYTHVDGASSLRVGQSTGAPDLALEQGSTRVIDAREDGGAARLRVLDTNARLAGNDVEGYVLAEKTGRYAMLCEWDAPLPVGRGGESELAQPGQCAIAKPSEPLYLAPGHSDRLGPVAAGGCEPDLVIGKIDPLLSPPDVAAAPMLGPWSNVPVALEMPRREACDLPGSGCVAIVEPPPVGGVPPGGNPIPRAR